MSTEIASTSEEVCGRAATPDTEGTKASLANQKRSPVTSRSGGASLTPIGSPTPERHAAPLHDRHHANSWTFCDLFSAQERPNSAPLEQKTIGPVSPVPTNKVYDGSPSLTPSTTALVPPKAWNDNKHSPQMPHQAPKASLTPEQPTFHPQPQRHQPWVMPLLESEASPSPPLPQSPASSSLKQKGLQLTNTARSRAPSGGGWDESLAGSSLAGAGTDARGSHGGGGSVSIEPFASTPSPERENAGHMDWTESPKPGFSQRSVQNTPEPPQFYSQGLLGPISTPSPNAMSSVLGSQNQHFLGMPRFPHGPSPAMMMPHLASSMLPPPLPGGGVPGADLMGMGFGGAFRPSSLEEGSAAHQFAASYQAYQQAYQFGAAAAAAAAAAAGGWRIPPCPPMPMGCGQPGGSLLDGLSAHGPCSGADASLTLPPPTNVDFNMLHADGQNGCSSDNLITAGSGVVEVLPKPSHRDRSGKSADMDRAAGAGGATSSKGSGRKGAAGGNSSGSAATTFDLANLPPEAAEVVGQVSQMSRSQAGSKYLQRLLLKGHAATVEIILSGVEEDIAALMCDAYGNYLCSVAFQACSMRQRQRMLEKLGPNVASIACDKRGTHALQALIGLLTVPEEQHLLMSSIESHVIDLCMDPNGTHVVQRLLYCFLPSVSDVIYSMVIDRMLEVAHHPYGLCVLKKCISQANQPGKHQDQILTQLTRNALDLVQSPYGNYAIQHALEEWGGERCTPIFKKLEGRMMQLSIQKFSSNVVEKLFCSAPADFRNRFIAELVESEKMSVLVNSNYGHYVAKRALQLANPDQARALVEAIKANLPSLPNRRLRTKWEKVMNGGDDDDDDMDRNMPPLPDMSAASKGGWDRRGGSFAGAKGGAGKVRGNGASNGIRGKGGPSYGTGMYSEQ
jgi:hypothetical protein